MTLFRFHSMQMTLCCWQTLKKICTNCFTIWKLKVNSSKTKVMHFRHPRGRKTDFEFRIDDTGLELTDNQKYLGPWGLLE